MKPLSRGFEVPEDFLNLKSIIFNPITTGTFSRV